MIQTEVIAQINIGDEKVAKNGNTYHTVGIKVGTVWHNNIFFGDDITTISEMEEMDKQTLFFYEEDWQGKPQKKFRLPSKNDILEAKVDRLEKEIGTLQRAMKKVFTEFPQLRT